MNDLISRSDVLELQRYNFGVSMLNSEEYIKVSDIEKMSTAYSVDKVVKELEEIINPKEMHFCRVVKGICIHDEDDIECIDCVAERAIEIVKHGGVNICKDCEYRHDNGNCLRVGGFCTAVDDKYCEKRKQGGVSDDV